MTCLNITNSMGDSWKMIEIPSLESEKRRKKRKAQSKQKSACVYLETCLVKEVCRLFYNRGCCRIKLSPGRVCSLWWRFRINAIRRKSTTENDALTLIYLKLGIKYDPIAVTLTHFNKSVIYICIHQSYRPFTIWAFSIISIFIIDSIQSLYSIECFIFYFGQDRTISGQNTKRIYVYSYGSMELLNVN